MSEKPTFFVDRFRGGGSIIPNADHVGALIGMQSLCLSVVRGRDGNGHCFRVWSESQITISPSAGNAILVTTEGSLTAVRQIERSEDEALNLARDAIEALNTLNLDLVENSNLRLKGERQKLFDEIANRIETIRNAIGR